VKGVGFFLGGLLLGIAGFRTSLVAVCVLVGRARRHTRAMRCVVFALDSAIHST
jgi:UPF0716 family protein affecting phage T7 exclusion